MMYSTPFILQKKRKSKSPRKCTITPQETQLEEVESAYSNGIPVEQIQYIQDGDGRSIIIKLDMAAGDSNHKQKPGTGVYPHNSSNDNSSGETERNSPVVLVDSPHGAQTGQVVATLSNAQTRHEKRVILETGGQPLSSTHSHSGIDNIHQKDHHQSNSGVNGPVVAGNEVVPPVYVFPIEQMQCVDDSSDSESFGERTPKKARLEFSHIARENESHVSGATDEERIRNLFPRLEDDRIVIAAEAMTSLSRGFGHL